MSEQRVVLVALDEGTHIEVTSGMTVVGRHPQCDARLDSLRISRRHAGLIAQGGKVLVRDLGSTNGTWINGKRCESGTAESGDEIRFAHIRYRVTDGGHPPAVDSPTKGTMDGLDGIKAAILAQFPPDAQERVQIIITFREPLAPDAADDPPPAS